MTAISGASPSRPVTDGERQVESVNTVDRKRTEGTAEVCTRARARETTEPSTEPTLGEFSRQWARGMRTQLTPPALWSEARPSLRSSWLYTRYGTHVPEEGPGRTTSRVSAWLVLPLRAVLLYVDWLAERPSRLVCAFLLYFVLAQFLPIGPGWLTL